MLFRTLLLQCAIILLGTLAHGQSIQGNINICEEGVLRLEAAINVDPSLNYSYEWYRSNRRLNYSSRVLEKKEVGIEDAGEYSCIIRTSDPKKQMSDPSFEVDSDTLSTVITVHQNPSNDPKPAYTRDGNDIMLHVARNDKNLKFQWIGPTNDSYLGAVVDIEQVRLDQLGEYTLVIEDTTSRCTTELKLDVESNNNIEKPANVFGTIDEDTGELTGVLRRADRNFPIYPCNILGRKMSDNFTIADPYTIWQIIGEIDNNYIIKYVPVTKYDFKVRDDFDADYYYGLYMIDSLEAEIARISRELKAGRNLPAAQINAYNAEIQEKSILISEKVDNIIQTFEYYKNSYYFRFFEYMPIDEIRSYFINDKKFTATQNFEESNKMIYDQLKKNVLNDVIKERYFLVNRTDFEIRSRVYKHRSRFAKPGLTAGTILIPVKLRFAEFQFSKDITLGPYFGFKWLTSNFRPNYYSLGFSTGITSVRLTPRNTNTDSIQEVQDIAAFTLSIGSIFEFNNVQLGFFVGWDWINNNRGDSETSINWDYQGKIWLSVGLGYSIISRPSAQTDKKRATSKADGGS